MFLFRSDESSDIEIGLCSRDRTCRQMNDTWTEGRVDYKPESRMRNQLFALTLENSGPVFVTC